MIRITAEQPNEIKALAKICDEAEKAPQLKFTATMARVIEELTEISAGNRIKFSDGLIYLLCDSFPWAHPFYRALNKTRSGRF